MTSLSGSLTGTDHVPTVSDRECPSGPTDGPSEVVWHQQERPDADEDDRVIQICVISLTGKKQIMTVNARDTVDDVLTDTLMADMVHKSQLRLQAAGQPALDGGRTLHECNVKHDDVLLLVQREDLETAHFLKGPRWKKFHANITMDEMQEMYFEMRREFCFERMKYAMQRDRITALEHELAQLRSVVARSNDMLNGYMASSAAGSRDGTHGIQTSVEL